jgi:hypothetical protein
MSGAPQGPPGPGARNMSVGNGPPSAGLPPQGHMPPQQQNVPPTPSAQSTPQSQQNLNQIVCKTILITRLHISPFFCPFPKELEWMELVCLCAGTAYSCRPLYLLPTWNLRFVDHLNLMRNLHSTLPTESTTRSSGSRQSARGTRTRKTNGEVRI